MTVQLRENDRGRVSAGDDKKKKAAPAVERAPVPEGATKDPGAALLTIGADSAATLLTLLQAAGGNQAALAETASLEEGRQAAIKGQADRDELNAMSESEKVAHHLANGGELGAGEGGERGAEPADPNAPPPGFEDPATVVAFHMERGAQIQMVADSYAELAASCLRAAGVVGLDEETLAVFQEMGNAYLESQTEASELKMAYDMVAAEMASNAFASAAMPAETLPAIYTERVAAMEAQLAAMQAALDALTVEIGEIDAEIAAAVAGQAAAAEELAMVMAQIAEAAGAAPAGGGAAGEQADPAVQMAPIQARMEASKATVSGLQQKKESLGHLSTAVSSQVVAMQGVVQSYYLLLGATPPVADPSAVEAGGPAA